MHFTKENLIQLHDRIVKFSHENLLKINKLGIDLNDEHDSFFVGMIIRQRSVNNDFSILYSNENRQSLTSQFILYRCLVDDFIHIIFILNQDDVNEMVTKLNADAFGKNFKKLYELAKFNEEQLGGNYEHYPTFALMDEVKEKMKKLPRREQHFSNKEDFKFKTFKTTGNLIRDLKDDDENVHKLRRAYFIWRKLSDYVHFSNLTYEEEEMRNPAEDHTYTEFAEIISYSYFVILNCFKHFEDKYDLKIVDADKLSEYYNGAAHE
jgi:hypothetical protein